MDVQAELKEGLHRMIEQIKDVRILQAVYVLLEREKEHEESGNDFFDTLDPILKESIEKGLQQIKEGKTVPHKEVKKRYSKWLK